MTRAVAAAATTTTTIAISALIARRLDILILAGLASAVLWHGLWMTHLTTRINHGIGETRDDVHEYRADVREGWRLTKIGDLLDKANQPIGGEPLTLPTPDGPVRAVPAEIDGEAVLVGVDASTELADVIDLRAAIASRDEAAL